MNIYEQQFLAPTAFNNGISVGDFYEDTLLSTGLPAGLVQPYYVSPTPAGSEFLSGQVPGNSTISVDLSTLKDTANNKFVLDTTSTMPGIKLDCERGFNVLLRKAGNVLISGYDKYGQKLTWGKDLVADNETPTERAFYIISSIQLTNSEADAADFSITTNYTIGLPYYSYKGIIPLSVSIEGTNDFVNILLYQTEGNEQPITKFYTYYEANELEVAQTLSDGRSRPMINVNPQNEEQFYNLGDGRILSVWQLVYGAGTLPHWLYSQPQAYLKQVNDLKTVIGDPPFNTGWIGYGG